jgi:hypothetical protein
MKVLVCGSRSWDDRIAVMRRLGDLWGEHRDALTVIAGGAHGADRIAASVCKTLAIRLWEVHADWKRYGKAAGVLRSKIMLDAEPDLVIAFWDGESPGTRFTVEEARRRSIPVEVIAP